MFEFLLILLALVIAYVLADRYPEMTQRWYARVVACRMVILGLVAVIIAFVFLGSGYLPLMLLGFLMFVYLGLFLLLDNPHKEVIRWFNS